jgi:hypothetical protein
MGGPAFERLHWEHEVVPIRPVVMPLLGLIWLIVGLVEGVFIQTGFLPTLVSLALAAGYLVWLACNRARLEARYPVYPALHLLALRVFETPRLMEFMELTDRWRWLGTIQQLDGPDTAGSQTRHVLHYLRGEIDQTVVADAAALEHSLASFQTAPDRQLRFALNSIQCTDSTWREALDRLLNTASVVVMDLASFSERHRGCVYELRQLMQRVPLQRVVLVIDRDTDVARLTAVLNEAASELAPTSPNHGCPPMLRAVRLEQEPPTEAQREQFVGMLLDVAQATRPADQPCPGHWARAGLPGLLGWL